MIAVWLLLAALGFAAMTLGAKKAATSASLLAERSRLPPFLIGSTVLAIGTDLPEIANSFVSSASGHGDLNVGDSFGSVATQLTLVLGLLPFVAGPMRTSRSAIRTTGVLTVVALAIAALLASDARLTRLDAAVLLAVWVVGSFVVHRRTAEPTQLRIESATGDSARLMARTVVAISVVAGGATIAVIALARSAAILGVPEFVMSFFVASIGTSLPELAFDITALRRGDSELALGDAFGSSLVDATLSVAAGPLLFPISITAHLAVRGALTAIVATVAAMLLLGRGRLHGRRNGAALLVLYAAFFLVLL